MFSFSKLSVNSYFFLFIAAILFIPAYSLAYNADEFSWLPPFQDKDEKPSITIIFDNSGSMLGRAYTGAFNSTNEYYGYFNPKSYYSYNSTPPAASRYFYQDDNGKWNGNWLNWATMHRADVARKVMGGGSYSGGVYDIVTQDGSNRVSLFTFNDSANRVDLNGVSRRMTIHESNITNIDHSQTAGSRNLIMTAGGSNHSYTMRVQESSKIGVLQAFIDKARMALFVYDTADPYHRGGQYKQYMSEDASTLNDLINDINTMSPETWTPLAETLWTVLGYISQNSTQNNTTGPRYRTTSYTTGATTDPYYFSSVNGTISCTKQNVILITDGESTMDLGVPTFLQNIVNPKPTANYGLSSDGSSYLIDVAYWGQTQDMRSDLPGIQNVDFYTVFAFGAGSNLLKDAARYGKFKDINGNSLPDLPEEYDFDDDGMPDNYFEAESGQELEAAITQAFQLATARIASGTAAAVTSQSHSGEGAVYQALFFPPTDVNPISAPWSGQIHAFMIDGEGNLREDTLPKDRQLDLASDKIIKFDEEVVYRYTDTNGDGKLSPSELNSTKETLSSISDISFLWSSSTWLNSLTDAQVVIQRNPYNSTFPNRYIFTFVDKNNDKIVDPTEQVDFVLSAPPSVADLGSADYFFNYLTLYETQTAGLALDLAKPEQIAINTLRTSSPLNFSDLQVSLAKRQVDFIRGKEVGNATIHGIQDIVRSRTFNGTPWRLGDIIYSSPAVVDRPIEAYHLTYRDASYKKFIDKYLNRRQMIYVGANDGMLHAFNGGFYNRTNKSFDLSRNGETEFPLGMEVWAYVPYNLLPHLKWLMDPAYGQGMHVSYMDLKPVTFSARIFFDTDGITSINQDVYPDGWGTLLVAGMRFGGSRIGIDINKDGSADRYASSAYVIMDVTNPEQPPNVLAEIAMPNQGYTTCVPAVMPMSTPNTNSTADNQWYLVFGSGPADSAGNPVSSTLSVQTSSQTGKLFVLDLKKLASGFPKEISTVSLNADPWFIQTEAGSFISEPTPLDTGIGNYNSTTKFKSDFVYFGTIAGSQTNALGKMYRLNTQNSFNPADWSSSIFIDVGQPISAGPSFSYDESNNLWVYFGTGRYFDRDDIPQSSPMSFYGVKDPIIFGNNTTVLQNQLFNSTQITLTNGSCGAGPLSAGCVHVIQTVGNTNSTQTWSWLESQVASKSGWRRDFTLITPAYERVLGKALVFGGAVVFTSYTPSNDICIIDGTSNLWALYYKTGTAYYKPFLGTIDQIEPPSKFLGKGLASSPTLHLGANNKATLITQLSTGVTKTTEMNTPNPSGPLFWRQNFN